MEYTKRWRRRFASTTLIGRVELVLLYLFCLVYQIINQSMNQSHYSIPNL